MRILRRRLLPLAVLGLLALGTTTSLAVAAGDEPAPVADDAVPPIDVRLSEVRTNPLPWVGRRVRFSLQFRATLDDWNPCLTRFGRVEWVGFAAWSDERFTWERQGHADPLQRLFVRRGSSLAEDLAEVHAYERFEVVAWVRELFLDEPWLEVESLRPLYEHIGAGTILHVGRARDLMRRQQWELALQQFERAQAAPLPAHARAELERQIIECTRAQLETHPRARQARR